jgi:hypothetical protein
VIHCIIFIIISTDFLCWLNLGQTFFFKEQSRAEPLAQTLEMIELSQPKAQHLEMLELG